MYSIGANLYQKLPILAILTPVSPHFKTTTVKFGVSLRTWNTLHHA